MRVLVVGVFLEDDLINRYNKISTPDAQISVASVKYTKLINAGFEECLNGDTEHIFLAPIGMYPKCKTLFWSRRYVNGIRYLRFINFIFLKQLSISLDLFLMIFKWNRKNKNEERIIVYTSVYLPFLFSAIPFKFFGNIKFVSFIPDLPTYSFSYSASGGFFKRKFTAVYIYLANQLNTLIDYYVFITKYMQDIYKDKPFTIIEGLADLNPTQKAIIQKSSPKAVMYAGALFQKFGVKSLLDAFIQIEGEYELWLFGSGDMIAEINNYALKNERIKYLGNQPHSVILDYQKRATLLINPRFSHEEFTKFSFPSKLIEYLSSGTPVLTTRLPGIPDDYDDKFYFIQDESVLGFKEALEMCLKKSNNELLAFGYNGKNFVLTEKNYILQIKKLIKNLHKFLKEKHA